MQIAKRNQVVEENLGLAIHMAKKFKRMTTVVFDWDDLVSVCKLALIKAAEGFDSNRNVKFGTYACTVIRNEVYKELNDLKGQNQNELASFEEEIQDKYKDIDESINVEKEVTDSMIVAQLEEVLTEEEYQVLKKLHMEGKTQWKVAEELGWSQPHICRLDKRICKKIRSFLGKVA